MSQAVFYNNATAIVPSDTVDHLNIPTSELMDAIAVGGAGTLAAVMQDGRVVTFTCTAGQLLPIRCRRVNATGTSATALVALYQV
jgi:hypothetical protein